MNAKYGVLFAILFLFSLSSKADMMTSDSSGNTLVLHEQKCSVGPWFGEWHTATMVYEGKKFQACWRLQGQTVVVVDSGGDVTTVPMQAFRRVTGV